MTRVKVVEVDLLAHLNSYERSGLLGSCYFDGQLYNIWATVVILSPVHSADLTLVLLNPDIPCFANSVDPDQLASSEAN